MENPNYWNNKQRGGGRRANRFGQSSGRGNMRTTAQVYEKPQPAVKDPPKPTRRVKLFDKNAASKPRFSTSNKANLNVSAVDLHRGYPRYYVPAFGPMEEFYELLIPRLKGLKKDYLKGAFRKRPTELGASMFYRSYLFRLTELYLGKIWLFNGSERFRSMHYDQVKALLNGTYLLSSSLRDDISNFIGDFVLFDGNWMNVVPLVSLSHHWLQASYMPSTNSAWRYNNVGGAAPALSDLPLILTPPTEEWPVPVALYGHVDQAPMLLDGYDDAANELITEFILNWTDVDNNHPGNSAPQSCTFYRFNNIVDPSDDWASWLAIPPGRGAGLTTWIGQSYMEAFPILDFNKKVARRPMLTRFFPWRISYREKVPFIVQFNCEFLSGKYFDQHGIEPLRHIAMGISMTLRTIIGSEIDRWVNLRSAEFVVRVPYRDGHMTVGSRFNFSSEDILITRDVVSGIANGSILVRWRDKGKNLRLEPLPIILRMKLPLWWHAYVDDDELDDMDGFFDFEDGWDAEKPGFKLPQLTDNYDLHLHFWKWCLAGIVPRWVPYRFLSAAVSNHVNTRSSFIQLDLLKDILNVEEYRFPSFKGSSLQLSEIYKSDDADIIGHSDDVAVFESFSAFLITDRANALSKYTPGPYLTTSQFLYSWEGEDQRRQIMNIVNSYFEHTIWK